MSTDVLLYEATTIPPPRRSKEVKTNDDYPAVVRLLQGNLEPSANSIVRGFIASAGVSIPPTLYSAGLRREITW